MVESDHLSVGPGALPGWPHLASVQGGEWPHQADLLPAGGGLGQLDQGLAVLLLDEGPGDRPRPAPRLTSA